jgi:hypothetical protein
VRPIEREVRAQPLDLERLVDRKAASQDELA